MRPLPKVTNGAYTANAKSQTEVGLSGFEIMKLLKLGTYDAVHGVTTYVAQDSPAIEGADLAGVIQDIDVYRKALESYEPIIKREFAAEVQREAPHALCMAEPAALVQLGRPFPTQTSPLLTLPAKRFAPIPRHWVISSKALTVLP
jgi:hypothetical protein